MKDSADIKDYYGFHVRGNDLFFTTDDQKLSDFYDPLLRDESGCTPTKK
jgi:hypothetical protein